MFSIKISQNFNNRSSRLEVLCKEGVLRNFAKFTGKCLCQSLFLNKVEEEHLFYRTPLVAASAIINNISIMLFPQKHFMNYPINPF